MCYNEPKTVNLLHFSTTDLDSSVVDWRRCVHKSELSGVCEEVQYPVTEGGTQAQNAKFANQFHGGDFVEC